MPCDELVEIDAHVNALGACEATYLHLTFALFAIDGLEVLIGNKVDLVINGGILTDTAFERGTDTFTNQLDGHPPIATICLINQGFWSCRSANFRNYPIEVVIPLRNPYKAPDLPDSIRPSSNNCDA